MLKHSRYIWSEKHVVRYWFGTFDQELILSDYIAISQYYVIPLIKTIRNLASGKMAMSRKCSECPVKDMSKQFDLICSFSKTLDQREINWERTFEKKLFRWNFSTRLDCSVRAEPEDKTDKKKLFIAKGEQHIANCTNGIVLHCWY